MKIGQMAAICISKRAVSILTHIRMDPAITMHDKYVNRKARFTIMTLALSIYYYHQEGYIATKFAVTYFFIIDEAGSGINGGWGAWSEWTKCPVTCGGDIQMRTRLCDNPPPQLGGKNCTADGSSATDIRRCNEDPCPCTYQYKQYLNTEYCYHVPS